MFERGAAARCDQVALWLAEYLNELHPDDGSVAEWLEAINVHASQDAGFVLRLWRISEVAHSAVPSSASLQ